MELSDAFEALRGTLEPLGIEIGPDVLALWRDRNLHGQDPLSSNALRRLHEAVDKILACDRQLS